MSDRPVATMPVRDLYAGMNKWERARAIELEAKKRAGAIADWWYERWTFKLADDCRYTPDFVVQMPNGALEVEEVKGFWRDDAKAKLRMFAATFPFPTCALSGTPGSWDVETFR